MIGALVPSDPPSPFSFLQTIIFWNVVLKHISCSVLQCPPAPRENILASIIRNPKYRHHFTSNCKSDHGVSDDSLLSKFKKAAAMPSCLFPVPSVTLIQPEELLAQILHQKMGLGTHLQHIHKSGLWLSLSPAHTAAAGLWPPACNGFSSPGSLFCCLKHFSQ